MDESGGIAVWKPAGMSSRAALEAAQKQLSIRPLGHTGTLDPLACGLLLLLGGEARKFQGVLTEHDKEYEARIVLGMGSSSEDGEGPLWSHVPRFGTLSAQQIDAVLPDFVGTLQQVPPRLSAIRVAGKRAYQRARRGEEVELAPRQVTVHSIETLDWSSPVLRLRIRCGSGTYIRSLARDLGRALGTSAFLASLRRTQLGGLREESSVPLARVSQESWMTIEEVLAGFPRIEVDSEAAGRLRLGQRLSSDDGELGKVAAWCDGLVVGLVEVTGGMVQPRRILNRPNVVPPVESQPIESQPIE